MDLIKRGFYLVAVLALLLSAGCGNADGGRNTFPPESPPPKTPETNVNPQKVYKIPLGTSWSASEYWVIDENGNEASETEEAASDYTKTDLIDLVTGEARYQYHMREETVLDGEGLPGTHRLYALYDLNGNQLTNWEEKNYSDAFGEYVIRQDSLSHMEWEGNMTGSYHTALYHVPTGTESFEGAYRAVELDGDNFLLLDTQNTTLGIINSSGEAVLGFPMAKPYYDVYGWRGFVTASLANPYGQTEEAPGLEYLLDFKDGNLYEVIAAEWMSVLYLSSQGDYLTYRNGGDWGVYQSDKGVVFETDGASIKYFDGEIAVVQTEDNPVSAALVTTGHKELAGGFSWLTPMETYGNDTPVEKFLGIADGKMMLADRTGNVAASAPEIPGMLSAERKYAYMLCDGLYTYDTETDESSQHGLLGPELEVLVPAGRYTSFETIQDIYFENGEWDKTAETVLLRAHKEVGVSNEPGHTVFRTDILNHTGKVIIDNVTEIYGAGPDRIALRRGFDVGLMDFEGNWIAKRKIFTGFGDD